MHSRRLAIRRVAGCEQLRSAGRISLRRSRFRRFGDSRQLDEILAAYPEPSPAIGELLKKVWFSTALLAARHA
jgi:hypothetical protein